MLDAGGLTAPRALSHGGRIANPFVEDIAASTQKAKSLGATIMQTSLKCRGRLAEHHRRSDRRGARTLEVKGGLNVLT
jgi:hypothetical protein